jgi:hypothetical protein
VILGVKLMVGSSKATLASEEYHDELNKEKETKPRK